MNEPIDQRLYHLLTPTLHGGELIATAITDDGFRVKRCGDQYVDVLRMRFDHRLVTAPVDSPEEYDRFWRYTGTGGLAFLAAVLAATMWDPAEEAEPLGWNKNGQTGEHRAPGTAQTWQTAAAPAVLADLLIDNAAWPDVPLEESN
jgi:hypothetical protein